MNMIDKKQIEVKRLKVNDIICFENLNVQVIRTLTKNNNIEILFKPLKPRTELHMREYSPNEIVIIINE